MTTTVPRIIEHYLTTASTATPDAVAACFTADGVVHDEGRTHVGREQIAAWRRELARAFTYTTTVTGAVATGEATYRVTARIEGDFPGGVADLAYNFVIDQDLIAELAIAPPG